MIDVDVKDRVEFLYHEMNAPLSWIASKMGLSYQEVCSILNIPLMRTKFI